MRPVSVSIRSYQVGFGDCFLVSFAYDPGEERHVLIDFGSTGLPDDVPKSRMNDVAIDIKKRSGGSLTAVVATHRHKDHVSGFAPGTKATGSGRIIASLKPKLVLQPWTEDPKLAPTATGPARPERAADEKRTNLDATASLSAMQQVSRHMWAEAKRARYLPRALKEEISFLGDDNLGNADAVKNLMGMGPNEYLHAGKRSKLSGLLPGVEVHVLGPPTVDQTDTIKEQRSRDEDEFWHLQAAAGQSVVHAAKGKVTALFPRHVRLRSQNRFPIDSRWLIHHAKQLRGEQMLRIVRMLDSAMNNTSLILLFRIGDKSLLFPGDAQIENWRYALGQADFVKLLKTVDVYKVGHHGSLNATPKTLWAMFERKSENATAPDRLTSIMSTMKGKHGSVDRHTEVPRKTLAAALERDSHLISTEKIPATKMYSDTVLRIPPPKRKK